MFFITQSLVTTYMLLTKELCLKTHYSFFDILNWLEKKNKVIPKQTELMKIIQE